MKKQTGFTLIELIVVIVILGILAAFALPKYISLDREARVAVTRGLEGSIRSATDMVHGMALAKSAVGTVDIGDGVSVDIATNRYPAASGISDALADTSGFTQSLTATAATYQKDSAADPENCRVVYTNPGTAGTRPTITYTTSGC